MRFKPGVNPFGITPELILGLMIADGIYSDLNINMTITSLNDSIHGVKSKHWIGSAGDIRTRDLPGDIDPDEVRKEIAENVGSDYDVLLESKGTPNEHIHIEYDPKRGN